MRIFIAIKTIFETFRRRGDDMKTTWKFVENHLTYEMLALLELSGEESTN